jgi:T5SS/PEP-CTERM-associated repeat protein
MEIRNGGNNSLPSAILGCLPGSSGTIRLTGTSSDNRPSVFQSLGSITIGGTSTGLVEVLQGGLFTSINRAVIGRDVGSTGAVLVAGQGAQWKHVGGGPAQPAVIVVGQSGLGLLTVAAGGLCQADALEIGVATTPGGGLTGFGTVTVQDTSSALTASELSIGTDKPAVPDVGEEPLGRGILTVLNNGTVNVQPVQAGDPLVVLTSAQLPNSIDVGRSGTFNAPNSKLVLAGAGQSFSVNGGFAKTGGGSIGNGSGPTLAIAS